MTGTAGIDSVVADVGASSDEIAAVEEAFRRAGFDVEVNADLERKSPGASLPWIVLVVVAIPVAEFLRSFGSEMGKEAGKDAYAAVKEWAKDVWRARGGGDEGSLVLEDPDGTHLILSARLPDRALDALADLDWTATRGHYLVWDAAREEWHDPVRPDGDAT